MKQFIKNETVFCAAAALAALSCLAVKPGREYLGYIDYRTLALLFCLMALVACMQEIGVFTMLGHRLLSGTHGTKKLSFILVSLCFFCSMLITNDVALITFVPFTILVYQMVGKEELLLKLVVLETIAANLGSMGTPIGNPQNLYLYSVSGLSMKAFMETVLPYTFFSMLLLGTFLVYPPPGRIPQSFFLKYSGGSAFSGLAERSGGGDFVDAGKRQEGFKGA